MWWSLAGTKYFLARGGFSVAEELSPGLLLLILKKITGVSVACTKQLQALSEFAGEDFFPPALAGEISLSRCQRRCIFAH